MTKANNGFLHRGYCPCCGADASSARVKLASSPPAETLPLDEHSSFASGYDVSRVFFTYVECGSCSVLYCPTYYRQQELERFYAHQRENMGEAPLEARQRTQEEYVRLLGRFSRMGGNFLEIGADIGLLASAVDRSGSFDKLSLYEPNLAVHAELSARLGCRRRADIRSSPFTSGDLPGGSVSTAAMIHVLDHLIDPLAVLKDVRDVLEPGGVLLLVVHNVRSVLAAVLGRRWPPYTLQHPQLFSPRSMAALLKSAGLECISVERTTNFYPAAHLVRAACSVASVPSGWIPTWKKPLIGMPLGNIAFIARKS